MGAARFAKSIAVVGISIAAIAVTNCTSTADCPALGCTNGATIRAAFSVPPSTFDGATFTLCFNGSCSLGFALVDGGSQAPGGDVQLVGSPNDVEISADGGGTNVEFDFSTRFSVKNGDTYEVKIVAADGTVLLNATKSATYPPVQSDGSDCTLACQEATIDVTP
jgi:hypothetical protein